jgi:hypothetical protein
MDGVAALRGRLTGIRDDRRNGLEQQAEQISLAREPMDRV